MLSLGLVKVNVATPSPMTGVGAQAMSTTSWLGLSFGKRERLTMALSMRDFAFWVMMSAWPLISMSAVIDAAFP